MRLTLEIVAKTLFDAEISGDSAEVERGDGDADAGIRRPDRPAWFTCRTGFPRPMNVRVERAIRRLERILRTIIAERRKSGEDRGDLLSMLLRAQDEESGRRMTDPQLRDEVMTLFMAGHETTANTLAWTWFLLCAAPGGRGPAARRSSTTVLDGRPPTVADLPRLALHRERDQRNVARLSHRMDGRPRDDRAGRAGRLPRSRSGRHSSCRSG